VDLGMFIMFVEQSMKIIMNRTYSAAFNFDILDDFET